MPDNDREPEDDDEEEEEEEEDEFWEEDETDEDSEPAAATVALAVEADEDLWTLHLLALAWCLRATPRMLLMSCARRGSVEAARPLPVSTRAEAATDETAAKKTAASEERMMMMVREVKVSGWVVSEGLLS